MLGKFGPVDGDVGPGSSHVGREYELLQAKRVRFLGTAPSIHPGLAHLAGYVGPSVGLKAILGARGPNFGQCCKPTRLDF